MNVIAYQPHSWFLFEDGINLYLDVNCSYSAFGIPMLSKLTPEEAKQYENRGHKYVEELAAEAQLHGITTFQPRNMGQEWHTRATEAVARWQSKQE